jgi:hypothetical protein
VIENKETFSWHTLALDSSSNSHAVFFLHQQDSLQFLSPDAKPMWQCDAPASLLFQTSSAMEEDKLRQKPNLQTRRPVD